MALEHHFVISVNEEGEILIDYETLEAHFSGEVWDSEKNQFFSRNATEEIEESYNKALNTLTEAITTGLDFMGGGD